MSKYILLILYSIACYFVGNVNFAILYSKNKKKDIRNMGSGNPGSLNMSRNFGIKFGLLTFFSDMLKGAVPTLVAFFIFKNYGFIDKTSFYLFDLAIYFSGIMVVLGHIYPVIYKFKGGKGIASTIGVLVVCESIHGIPWLIIPIMSLIAAVVFIYLTEFGAMGSFIAITPSAICGAIRLYLTYWINNMLENILPYIITNMLIFLICFITWFAHRKNIERMLSGDEHATSIKAMIVKNKSKNKN